MPSEYSSDRPLTPLYVFLILYQVAFPTIPSGVRLKMRWNSLTAASVSTPKNPSTSSLGIAG